MKSQRRHDLETNELAASLMQLIERGKEHTRPIFIGLVLAVAAVIVVVGYPAFRGAKGASAADAFREALYSSDAESMRDFVKDYPNAPQVPLARLTAGDRLVREAVVGLKAAPGEDLRAKAARLLSEAKDLYNEVAAKDLQLAPLAQVDLALVMVQEGDLDKGRAALQQVAEKWPDSLAAAKAKLHLEALAGYKPVVFSDEPLKEEKAPAAKPAEGKEGETKEGPAKAPETKPPEKAAKETPPAAKPKG